jgi:DNA replication protein DnaC
MNFSNKTDNDNRHTRVVPMPGQGGQQQMDYYSIMSSFQHMVIARQMELQNVILHTIKERFGIRNAMVNMLVLLVISNPSKAYAMIVRYIAIYTERIWWTKKLANAWWKGMRPPKKVQVEVNYIHENIINHLYIALDWYLKNTSIVVSDHNHILGLIKEPIVASSEDNIKSIQTSYPQKTVTQFDYKGKIINFSKDCSDTTVYSPGGEIKKKNYQIILWSTDCDKTLLEKLCLSVANKYAKSKIDKVWHQKMFTNNASSWTEQPLNMNRRKVATVILDDGLNNTILESIKHFIDTEEWHLERGINYKKSYLFYGPPGTGKTSMIKALSFEIERHIHFLNLATVESDDQLNKLMSSIDFKNTIVVMEDIDAMSKITHSRKKTEEEELEETTRLTAVQDKGKSNSNPAPNLPKLTLSGLLNQLDGLRQTHGMILVMTSNHPEVLDDALIRDGRVDEKILFSYASLQQIQMMFKNFYNGDTPNEKIINNKLSRLPDTAPSTVESAMRKHYKDPIKALDFLIEMDISKKNGLDLNYHHEEKDDTVVEDTEGPDFNILQLNDEKIKKQVSSNIYDW